MRRRDLAPRGVLGLVCCAAVMAAAAGCSPQGETSGSSTSPTVESSDGPSQSSPTSDGDQGSSSSTTLPPDSSQHPTTTTTMAITSLEEAGEKLNLPADATVVVPEGTDAFSLRIPTCPSSGFDIDVTAEGNWVGRPSQIIAGDGCASTSRDVELFREATSSLFEGEIEVVRDEGEIVLSGRDVTMVLTADPS